MPWLRGNALNHVVVVNACYRVSRFANEDVRTVTPPCGSTRVDLCYRLIADDKAPQLWDTYVLLHDPDSNIADRANAIRLALGFNPGVFDPFILPSEAMRCAVFGKVAAVKVDYDRKMVDNERLRILPRGLFPVVWSVEWRNAWVKYSMEKGIADPYTGKYHRHDLATGKFDKVEGVRQKRPEVPDWKKRDIPL